MDGLNLGLIKETKIPRPPIHLQNSFASIHMRVDTIKTRYQSSLTDLEQLYAALSKKAFAGQLDVSRVPLIKTSPAPQDAPISEREGNSSPTPHFTLPKLQKMNRHERINQWLSAYYEHRDSDAPFSTNEFIALVNEQLMDVDSDESPAWGEADYDQLKTWLFSAIASGTMSQTYKNEVNRVVLHKSSTLRKRSSVP
jgi:type I restriction enzyme S subunit